MLKLNNEHYKNQAIQGKVSNIISIIEDILTNF
jgi:hypothetical protein